jgi:hypothetical protein
MEFFSKSTIGLVTRRGSCKELLAMACIRSEPHYPPIIAYFYFDCLNINAAIHKCKEYLRGKVSKSKSGK